MHVWNELLIYTRPQSFFPERPQSSAQYAAAAANVVLLGIVLFGAIRLVRRIRNRFGPAWTAPIVLFLAALPANAARSYLSVYLPMLCSGLLVAAGVSGAILVYTAALLCLAFLLLRLRRRLGAIVMGVLLSFAPLLPVEIAGAVGRLRTENPRTRPVGISPTAACSTPI